MNWTKTGLAVALLASFLSVGQAQGKPKVLHLPMRSSGPGSLDPIMGSTVYDHRAACNFYETLLQYKYLKRPYELEPLLLEEMPTTDDGLTWRFKLKEGVRFHDDPCFPGGKGREIVTAHDVVYSWKRFADKKYELRELVDPRRTLSRASTSTRTPSTARVDAGECLRLRRPRWRACKKCSTTTSFEVVLRPARATRFLWKCAACSSSRSCRERPSRSTAPASQQAPGGHRSLPS